MLLGHPCLDLRCIARPVSLGNRTRVWTVMRPRLYLLESSLKSTLREAVSGGCVSVQ